MQSSDTAGGCPAGFSGEGCPFGHSDNTTDLSTREKRDNRIRMLYEEYISLNPVRETWSQPVTENPRLEPCFTAGMQGVELAFLLLAYFLNDDRTYVVKRPRLERVAQDIQTQYRLLAEIIDGELEDENLSNSVLGTLTQNFPFEDAPPTSQDRNCDKARQSLALEQLISAVKEVFPTLRPEEQRSLKKIIRNVTGTFLTCFSEWTVGVGVEEQLSEVRELVGLSPFVVPFRRKYLDFTAMVRPSVISDTLIKMEYRHKEDFFFRSVHLGTECWAFVALKRLNSAVEQISVYSHWDNAAAHVRSASHIFDYLGDHVMMLTSMVLRDYLKLKVEIEGTSGAGSDQVKMIRKMTETLFPPFVKSLSSQLSHDPSEEEIQELILELYQHPERHPGMYNYAKALETIESGLLGGFFFKHFCLANNVIGSDAKGTMKMSVRALKKTYERPVFPVLDFVRAELGRRMDDALVHLKGKIMNEIEEKRQYSSSSSDLSDGGAVSSYEHHPRVVKKESFEHIRSNLFASIDLPKIFSNAIAAENDSSIDGTVIKASFLDHAWGKTPTSALVAAAAKQFALYNIGNRTWGKMFGELIPEATRYVKRLLKASSCSSVEYGHNSHELISRLLTIKLENVIGGSDSTLRILTTDTEFYSFTRQINRLCENSIVHVDTVPIHPIETFESRFFNQAELCTYDVIYSSQCVFLTQETIISDVQQFLNRLHTTTLKHGLEKIGGCEQDIIHSWKQSPDSMPYIIVDGYHGFGAIPTDLGTLPCNAFYVAGVLKHVASGANCAFLVCPGEISLRPLITGWMADPSVLGADSAGISVGSEVGYVAGLSLMGGTPAFLPSLIIFIEVMRKWHDFNITVDSVHKHVLGLHEQFLANLPESGPLSNETLIKPGPEQFRSHTLTFKLESPVQAMEVVNKLRSLYAVEVDSRKNFLRIGFGLNHSAEDTDLLCKAAEKII